MKEGSRSVTCALHGTTSHAAASFGSRQAKVTRPRVLQLNRSLTNATNFVKQLTSSTTAIRGLTTLTVQIQAIALITIRRNGIRNSGFSNFTQIIAY